MCTAASSTSRPFARCAIADAITSTTASVQARVFRRARPRDRKIIASPKASATVRAASGTPGGNTPSISRVRSANSGVSAETIDITPASVAAHARATGVAGRRTGHTVAGPDVRRRSEERPAELVFLARFEDREHLVAHLELGLLIRDLGLARADDGDQPGAVRKHQRPDTLPLAVRPLVHGHLDDLEVLLAQLEQLHEPVLG